MGANEERVNPNELAEKCCMQIYAAFAKHEYKEAEKNIADLALLIPTEAARLKVSLWIEQGDIERAQTALKELQLLSQDVYTIFLESRIMFMQTRYVSARKLLQKLVKQQKLNPAYKEKFANLLGQCCRRLGENHEAAQNYLLAAQNADSRELQAMEYSNYLFNLHYLPASAPAIARRAAKGFNKIFAACPQFRHRWREKSAKKLKVGYVSPDIREHVVLCFSAALFSSCEKDESISVSVYAIGREDDYSRRVAAKVDRWRNLQGIEPAEAARIIYEDEIDILVDLSGHTANNALPILAYKPAPVQISGIGFFSSTGLAAVDYFLGDVWLDDVHNQQAFTEKILLLPQSHFCYQPLQEEPLPHQLAYERCGYITFGSFNNFSKVNDKVLQVWKKILDALPEAHLLLKADIFDSAEGKEYTLNRLRRLGLPMARIECRGVNRDYLREYGDMDIALDTFPYPGGGTSCDALYMGVPLITMTGQSHGERFGSSLLHNIGLSEFIAHSEDEYIELAISLAGDSIRLRKLHENLRVMMQKSPLMDKDAYRQDIASAYWHIWHAYCEQQERLDIAGILRQEPYIDKFSASGDLKQALAVADSCRMAKARHERVLLKAARVYIDGGELNTAEEILETLPITAETLYLRAEALGLGGKYAMSNQLCHMALEHEVKENWLIGALHHRLAENAKKTGDRQRAAIEYRQSSRCKELTNGKAEDYSNYLFNLQFYEQSQSVLYEAACGYGQLFSQIDLYRHRQRAAHTPLRIGYISADFCRHVAAVFSNVFFSDYDREKFRIYGYFCGVADEVTAVFSAKADVWRNLYGLSPQEKAAVIYQDEIDILVDLSGHTGGSSLPALAYKPALVQVSGIGYFATTGLPVVDYFLADVHTATAAEDGYFVERLLRLPQSHFCYNPFYDRLPASKQAPAIGNGYITFGSLNQWDKITDELLSVWSELLKRVPESHLLLKAGAFSDPQRCEQEKRRLDSAGIPVERVQMEGYTTDYLEAYGRIDIALDSYPYPGGGTTCDALYMGVPVVTRYGSSHHTRFGLSMLKNIGLEELAAQDFAEYIAKAVALAEDRELLYMLHENLQKITKRSPLMQGATYMRSLEALYQKIAMRG